jgi:hypothetical protein
MTQKIINTGTVDTQLNVQENLGIINVVKKTRFSKRFEKLNTEVASDERYEGTMESLKYYLTKRDGIDMPTKLRDGGFKNTEIIEAARRKEKFAKKLEINRFFESAQWIDSQLFAIIKMKFEAHVDPLICSGSSKENILKVVVQNVIEPVLEVINIEGENDEVLNYNAEDIFGMIYYLTGQCHLNWKDYDSIQPSI